jgi:hypothetical protein
MDGILLDKQYTVKEQNPTVAPIANANGIQLIKPPCMHTSEAKK